MFILRFSILQSPPGTLLAPIKKVRDYSVLLLLLHELEIQIELFTKKLLISVVITALTDLSCSH